MLKIKTFVIIIIIYLIAFISLKTNINLFYPFYLLKDLVFLPVEAIKTEVELSNQVYEGIVIEQQKEFEELLKLNKIMDANARIGYYHYLEYLKKEGCE